MVALCAPPTRSVLEEEEEEDEGGGGGGWKKTEVGGLLLNHQEEVEAMSSPGGAASSPWRSVRHQHGRCWLAKAERSASPGPRWGKAEEGRKGSFSLSTEGVLPLGRGRAKRRPSSSQRGRRPEVAAWASSKEFGMSLDGLAWVGMSWDGLGWVEMVVDGLGWTGID